MTASLTPTLALDYITALSADIRAAVVLDAAGNHLAGPVELASVAATLPRAPRLEGGTEAGAVYAARDERHAIVVVTGPFALSRVTRHDLQTALAALGGQMPPTDPPEYLPDALVNALLSVV